MQVKISKGYKMLTQLITILLIILWVLILATTVTIWFIDTVFSFMSKGDKVDCSNKNYAEEEM